VKMKPDKWSDFEKEATRIGKGGVGNSSPGSVEQGENRRAERKRQNGSGNKNLGQAGEKLKGNARFQISVPGTKKTPTVDWVCL